MSLLQLIASLVFLVVVLVVRDGSFCLRERPYNAGVKDNSICR